MTDTQASALGCQLPDFSAASLRGEFRPSQYHGRWLVLYFYPKDNTPGCTQESREFAQAAADFAALGADIVGASRDSLRSHERFRDTYQLPFDLIADPDETVCNLFNVMKAKKMYGKPVRGIERSTFLFDPAGVLRHEWRGLKVDDHVAQVLATLRQLQANDA